MRGGGLVFLHPDMPCLVDVPGGPPSSEGKWSRSGSWEDGDSRRGPEKGGGRENCSCDTTYERISK